MGAFERRDLVLLAPIMPAATGNGLAMRCGVQLRALSERYEVRLVVVPVAGGVLKTTWAAPYVTSASVVLPGDPAELRAGAARLVGDAAWRDRLHRTEPFPDAVAYASPALAASVVEAAGGIQGARVHAIRAYLAPLAVAVAELVGAPWTTLDLDDDDEHLLEREGHHEEARAYARILETFGPEFGWLSLASPDDAARVAKRHGLPTTVIANSVTPPSGSARRSRRAGGRRSLLFVGNLTYGPNVEAAELLAREILPLVTRLVDQPVGVELVGGFDPGGPLGALAALDGVVVRGYVEDLEDAYARADLAVVPLARGSGSRIKLLEALAAGVPIVTTTAGAAGLAVEQGLHLLMADDVQELAAAVARVLLDEQLATSLARAGRSLVEERYTSAAVGRQIRTLARELDSPPSGSRSGDQSARREL